MAASIHDESKRPIKALRNIPTERWNSIVNLIIYCNIFININYTSFYSQTERFAHQVYSEQIALSGRKFFHLTRTIIITIIGTIVTYELVLLQMDVEPGMFEPCA